MSPALHHALRRGGPWALVIAGGLVLWTARVVIQSRAELRDAEAQLAARDFEAALESFGRAARLDAPGNPWSRRALERLAELAAGAEARGDRVTALATWREVRSAILATRGLLQRNTRLRERADRRIARLAAALESPSVDPGSDEEARVAWHAARLAQDEAPSAGWSLAALTGLCAWVASAFGLLVRGFDERLRIRRGPALGFAAGITAGFVLFLVALARRMRLLLIGDGDTLDVIAELAGRLDYDEISRPPTTRRRSWVPSTRWSSSAMNLRRARELVAAVLAAGEPAYVGLCAAERDALVALLKLSADRVPKARLDRLAAPAGLPIHAQSVEERAIAVVAQLIAERRAPATSRRASA